MSRSIRRRIGSRRVTVRRSRGRRVAVRRSKSRRISVGGRRRRLRSRRGGFRDGRRAFDLHGAMKDGAAAFV